MNIVDKALNVANHVVAHYPSKVSLGAGLILGAAVLEMFVRVFIDIRNRDGENFGKDLGGVIFYGLLAANIVPYTAVAGATFFVGYSLFFAGKDATDPYWTARAINKLIVGTCEKIIFPIIDKVCQAVKWVFDNIVWPIGRTVGYCLGLVIPKHPIWIGVTAVVALIAVYHFAPLLLTAAAVV